MLADKSVGTGKAVTASGYSLSGTDAGNYSLIQPTDLSANITRATMNIDGVTAANKAYNVTTVATLTGGSISALGSDMVTLETANAHWPLRR